MQNRTVSYPKMCRLLSRNIGLTDCMACSASDARPTLSPVFSQYPGKSYNWPYAVGDFFTGAHTGTPTSGWTLQ